MVIALITLALVCSAIGGAYIGYRFYDVIAKLLGLSEELDAPKEPLPTFNGYELSGSDNVKKLRNPLPRSWKQPIPPQAQATRPRISVREVK